MSRTTPWIPSHQDLGRHPKTRKAARKAGVSIPTMVGHLHLLWHWALELAPDGDLSRFDDDDLADAALWEDDPQTFVSALVECGPGDQAGFLESDRTLHDWDDYGGRYHKRVAAAKKGAEARWSGADAEPEQSDSDATALPTHSHRTADALPPDSERNANRNAEERRGEDKREETQERESSRKRSDRAHRLPEGWQPDPEPDLEAAVGGDLAARREFDKFVDHWRSAPGQKGRKVDWQATWRNWLRRAAENNPQTQTRADGLVM